MGLMDFLFGTNGKGKNKENRSNCSGQNRDIGFTDNREEYAQEITSAFSDRDIVSCLNNGVQIHDMESMVKVMYDGTLAKNGAEEVFAVIGYGDNNSWENVETLPMKKISTDTFELLTTKKQQGNINVAFKDDKGNWDNNSGQNYIFYDANSQSSH